MKSIRSTRDRRHAGLALIAVLTALPIGTVAAQQPGSTPGEQDSRAEAAELTQAGLDACLSGDVSTSSATAADIVRFLADDSLEGRFAGSNGERCAGEFIARAFEHLGLRPAGEQGFFQDVPLASAANPHAPPAATGRNVIALLEGTGNEGEVVVVGAHYDHLGHGGYGSLAEGSGDIHNGADDNASGVAAMLAAAARLASGPAPARSVLFVAFTGEELGLLGSSHYVKNPAVPLDRTIAMINLDMVGRLGDGELIVYGIGTAEEWDTILRNANEGLGIPLALQDAGYGPSDHTSFYTADIPVLHFFTNVHGDYHRPTDDWEKIDVDGLERVSALVAGVAWTLSKSDARLALIRGAGAPQQRASGYGAYLGSIPDFTPVDHGVLLSGVSGGSPAELAGIRKGDTIVQMGRHEIADLYGLTDALQLFEPGDRVEVQVLRDGERVSFEVVLGSREDR